MFYSRWLMATYSSPVEVHGVILCLYKWLWDNGDRLRRFQVRVSDTPISGDDIFGGKRQCLEHNLSNRIIEFRGERVLEQHCQWRNDQSSSRHLLEI